MNKHDLIHCLSRIAKSGTREFQELLQSGDASLIGQFGVGFYSAFLVAEKVTLITKHFNDPTQYVWQSDASAQFSISADPRGNTLGRGTQIILHLKEEGLSFLDRDRLVAIIRHYSMFVEFPVRIWNEHEEVIQEIEMTESDVPDFQEVLNDDQIIVDSDDSSDIEGENLVTFEERDKPKGLKKTVWMWERVNNKDPLWMRDPDTIPQADYTNFYKAFFHESGEPLHYIHFKGEGRFSFNALLFIPSSTKSHSNEKTRNIRLYVKRVLVSDEWGDELVPGYLNFIKGVIDSSDLELNVDRDHLTQMKTLSLIKRRVTSKLFPCTLR